MREAHSFSDDLKLEKLDKHRAYIGGGVIRGGEKQKLHDIQMGQVWFECKSDSHCLTGNLCIELISNVESLPKELGRLRFICPTYPIYPDQPAYEEAQQLIRTISPANYAVGLDRNNTEPQHCLSYILGGHWHLYDLRALQVFVLKSWLAKTYPICFGVTSGSRKVAINLLVPAQDVNDLDLSKKDLFKL